MQARATDGLTSTRQPGVRCAPRLYWPAGVPVVVCVGLLLALGASDAGAAALGSLTTPVGLFAALAALFAIKGWPAQLPASALSTGWGALVVVGGAAWWWRTRPGARAATFLPGAGGPGRSASRPAEPSRRAGRVDLPAGIEHDTLLAELRLHFVRLQEAWDLGAIPDLRMLTTPEMLGELRGGLLGSSVDAPARTEVVTLHAELFELEDMGGSLLASVEFSGLIRESAGEGASPFRELWLLTRSNDGAAGWKLARHQTLM